MALLLHSKSGFIVYNNFNSVIYCQYQDMKVPLYQTRPISLLVEGHLSNQEFYFI